MRFQEISEKSREEMKKYLEKAKNRGCNYTVGNILIWGADLPITYGIVADVIVFRTLLEKEVVYHIAEYTDDFSYIIQKNLSTKTDSSTRALHSYGKSPDSKESGLLSGHAFY